MSKDWALVSPFVFSQTDIDAIVDRELHGRPTVDANLTSESGGKKGLAAGQSVLSLETQVLSDLDKSERARDKVLLEILHTEEKKIVDKRRAVAKKVFTNGIKNIMLKQFRDADEPTRACYQALVRFRWKIRQRSEIVTQNRATIKITDYANFPIAQTLGLTLTKKDNRKDREGRSREIAELQPQWSLSIEVAMEKETGTTVCWRAGTGDWKREDDEEKYNDNKKPLSPMNHPEVKKIMQTQEPDKMIEILFRGE